MKWLMPRFLRGPSEVMFSVVDPRSNWVAEEDSVIRLSDAVSADLGIIGNTGSPQYKDNPGPLSTFGDSYAANPLILKFGDGTRANVGYGPLDGAPTVGGTIYGF